MTPEEFYKRMKECESLDVETGHAKADDLMCEVLRQWGYGDGVDVFTEMDKWYA